ncbi:GntR family transcriptional regulator [Paenibacillus swuensis]|uniref:GntR family transcriptional regulator n=1 Tax=Paenibacillus swuensis TaxID=1178515 RepID=A0A172TH74_9BACL|nr:PLP-dependent aminotransferase family protein [Paenibacillus swuensis]ANE46322.1 GntR family transcriptional regulator [Paenibacillus swuensis]
MWFSIDSEGDIPMFRQVFEAFRESILTGKMPAGYKLPSTRELAAELHISRNVILEAYELLLAEGYITGRSGAGTYVAEGTQLRSYSPMEPVLSFASKPESEESERDLISFRTGLPAVDLFPMKKWGTILQSVCMDATAANLGYGDSCGVPELRLVLAEHLWKTRGVICRPEQIVITSGAVQALQLIVRLLLSSRDHVLVEDPSNEDLKSILTSTGAALQGIPVDDFGIMTHLFPADVSPQCIYVTPSHQFPMGGILPIQRRIELIEYVRQTVGYIIEDDYDSEFRYDGAPVQSLQSLCPDQVLYIGTFSKTMFPSLRIGYMIVPEPLVDGFRQLKRLSDYQTPSLEQLALVHFINQGHLSRHIQKMKKLYRRRRNILLSALTDQFGGDFRICGRAAGLHLVADFEAPFPDGLQERFREEGVYGALISGNGLLLGYGHLNEEQILEGVLRIGKAMRM